MDGAIFGLPFGDPPRPLVKVGAWIGGVVVAAGNSLANMVSATSGGVVVHQAINAASLGEVTDLATATA